MGHHDYKLRRLPKLSHVTERKVSRLVLDGTSFCHAPQTCQGGWREHKAEGLPTIAVEFTGTLRYVARAVQAAVIRRDLVKSSANTVPFAFQRVAELLKINALRDRCD